MSEVRVGKNESSTAHFADSSASVRRQVCWPRSASASITKSLA